MNSEQGRGGHGNLYARAGGRVGLQLLSAEDEGDYLRLSQVSFDDLQPWIQPPTQQHEFELLLARAADHSHRAFCIRRLGDRSLAGMLHLSQIFWGPFCSAYLSYWVGSPHRQQGLASEALRLLLFQAFGPLGLHRLEANIQPGNLASARLVQACGFVQEGYSEKYLQVQGEWRDHERWAIHYEIWPESETIFAEWPRWQS